MTLFSKAPPECDVELLRQEVFAARFIGHCQFYGHLDAANVPNFQMHGNIEDVCFVLDNIDLLVALFEYNGELLRDTCFFLHFSVSKSPSKKDN